MQDSAIFLYLIPVIVSIVLFIVWLVDTHIQKRD